MGGLSEAPSPSAVDPKKKDKNRNKGRPGDSPSGAGGPGGNSPEGDVENDTITGAKGDDTLTGGAGNDTLGGGASRAARAAAAAGKPGGGLLDPKDKPGSGKNLLEAANMSRISDMLDGKPSRGQIGPAAYEQSAQGPAKGPAKGAGGTAGGGGVGHDDLAQQVAQIQDMRNRQKQKDMERERQALERAAAWSGYTGPGPSAPGESNHRGQAPDRQSLLDPAPKKTTAPPPDSLSSAQHARALGAIERARGYLSGPTPKAGSGSTVLDRRRHDLNAQALEDIKAFDQKVAPQAEIEEARNRSLMEDWRSLKELAKGPNKPNPLSPTVAVPTEAQIAANARMVEALTRTTNNKALADLFAETLLSGSPMAQSVYGDFIGQLNARAPDRVEAFEDAVKDSLAEISGWNDSDVKDVVDMLGSLAKEFVKTKWYGGLLPKKGFADSYAYRREMLARRLDYARKKDGKLSWSGDIYARNLDKNHKFIVDLEAKTGGWLPKTR